MLRRLKALMTWSKPVLLSRYIGLTLVTVLIAVLVVYSVFNFWVMPAYTRHNARVSVPDIIGLQVEDAEATLLESGLDVRRVVSHYVATAARNSVVDQDPKPNEVVKPGRRVYLRVNSGSIPMVVVPALKDLSIRQARNTLLADKLTLGAVLRDTIPSPYRNTVTRQEPESNDSVAVGSAVDIWISSGLGSTVTTVPDLVGLMLPEAENLLRAANLQFVVFDDPDAGDADPNSVIRVIPPAGSTIPEGSEVRMFVSPDTTSFF